MARSARASRGGHAPDTECVSKGKLRKPSEVSHKLGIVTTARGRLVVGALTLYHQPFDGHTMAACIQKAEGVMGRPIGTEIYVDRDYKSYDYEGPAQVLIARLKHKQEPALRSWRRKCNGIQATISHMKNEDWLGRNYPYGVTGSSVKALRATCGEKQRKLFRHLAHAPAAPLCALMRLLVSPCCIARRSHFLPG